MDDASPTKWHLAHTSWFFETFVLAPGLPGYRPFHPAFRVLFNSYYNSVGEQHPRPQRGLLTRPALDEVLAYRAHVDRHVARAAGRRPRSRRAARRGGRARPAPRAAASGADPHRRQAPARRQPAAARVCAAARVGAARRRPRRCAGARYPGGRARIGHDGGGFAFDNEQPRHRGHAGAFALATRAGHQRRVSGVHRRRRLPRAPSSGCPTAGARCRRAGWRRAALLGATIDGAWHEFTLAGLRARRSSTSRSAT